MLAETITSFLTDAGNIFLLVGALACYAACRTLIKLRQRAVSAEKYGGKKRRPGKGDINAEYFSYIENAQYRNIN